MLPAHDFGGSGPLLHLGHANGYPPAAYRQLAAALTDRYQVISYPARPLWPGTRPDDVWHWRTYAVDLLAAFDGDSVGPLVGVGHSLGGMTLMMAAAARPAQFRALVVIDPVLFNPRMSFVFSLAKPLRNLIDFDSRMPLIKPTLRRQRVFDSHDAMFTSYRDKRVFARLGDAALWDYVRALGRPNGDGNIELAWPPEWEAQIYRTMPHDGWRLPRKLRAPLLILRGQYSDTFSDDSARLLQRRVPGSRYVEVPDAGHLLPLEAPEVVAGHIHAFLDDVLS